MTRLLDAAAALVPVDAVAAVSAARGGRRAGQQRASRPGHALTDDATVLCLDWYGDHGHERAGASGADVARASQASG